MIAKNNPKLLLHVCCAVCAASLAKNLEEKYAVSLFFYNPNIHPKEEYNKRRDSVIALSKNYGLDYFEGEYDSEKWVRRIKGFEEEPEGGERCPICFRMRLRKTALFCEKNNFPFFATTLAQSHLKDCEKINKIGQEVSEILGVKYLEFNRVTRNRDQEREYYHQKYCGCIFSKYQPMIQ
ncbi:MAG: epoxyqueuosine reductase QueH [bacterium]|nr:epoxyqueuosine reductase QueH [bacterium]